MSRLRLKRTRTTDPDRVAAHVAELAAELRRPVRDRKIRLGYRRPRLLLTALVLTVVTVGGISSLAAYNARSDNAGDAVASGTVSITDNDGATAMLSLSNAHPGATDTGCIKVSFDGTLTSSIRLHGTTTGSGLDRYLDLKITRGAYSPSDPGFHSCTNFSADATDYIGAGTGVIYDGTLEGFADSYASGLIDPTSGSPESWTNGETHVYKLEVTLQNDNSAEGKNATQSFVWEARNL